MISSVIALIILFSVLITIHEFGHFIIAKRNGVKVEKFSIGFGPKIFEKKKGDTTYTISLILFGGYVKLAGEEIDKEEFEEWEYMGKSPGIRSKILFAGSFNNLIFGFILLIPVFLIGTISYEGTKIGEFVKNFPAEKSGLKIEDEILEVNGVKCKTWLDVTLNIKEFTKKNKDIPVNLKVKRDNQILVFNIKPAPYEIEIKGEKQVEYIIGILPKEKLEKYPFHLAIIKSFKEFYNICSTTIFGLKLLFQRKLSIKHFTGPVGISEIAVAAWKVGLVSYLQFMAILSINLGIINLIPYPVLDGGHIFGLLIERIRRKRPSKKMLQIIQNIGAVSLILFAVYITYQDLGRIFEKNLKLK
ncbi:MAG: RIP metalloprotease RseP [Candidatus Omnitrophica bacterium]|nr:RIP metalloprotease RseP [Candidatus Omnitrophota bacterium]MCM8810862.1 RIP metalloprotease RseP [Candidatus Omnitrophota bacterium]MCM8833063.1 RIP metalloprotease RseP [Candidatus Omnitrophota bacterium]